MYVVVYQVGYDWNADGQVTWIPKELNMKVWAATDEEARERCLDRVFNNNDEDKVVVKVVASVKYN